MVVRGVRLVNVRSRRFLELELKPGLNVLYGPNGAGKTTVLEAIALVLRGMLLRPGTVRDLINRDEDFLRVEIDLAEGEAAARAEVSDAPLHAGASGGLMTAGAAFSRRGERRLTAGGALLEDSSRWRECVPIRTFVPDDLRLVKGGPWRRREYLDGLATLIDPAYPDTLRRYGEALAQRNALLRSPRGGADGSQFSPWEGILARTGLAVSGSRAAALASFTAPFQRTHAQLTGEPEGSLRLVYRTNVADLEVGEYEERLEQMRPADQQRTYTQLGPHRDDLRLLRKGLDVGNCASQGEQRAAVLALVLAEWQQMSAGSCKPLLLLDDVMSELDEVRKRALVALVRRGGQTVITTTDLRYFSPEELRTATVAELPGD